MGFPYSCHPVDLWTIVSGLFGPSNPIDLLHLTQLVSCLFLPSPCCRVIFDTGIFMEVILLIAIMSFIGTVSFSKFIEKGEIIDVTVIANILIVLSIVVGIVFTIVTVIGIIRLPDFIHGHMRLLKVRLWAC